MLRLVFISIAFILFPISYPICDFFFYSEMNKWDNLRHCLYMLNIAIVCLAYNFSIDIRFEKYVKLISYSFIWWEIIPSLIGRFYGETEVLFLDLLSIFIGLYFGSKDLIPELHKLISLFFVSEEFYNKYVNYRSAKT